MERARRLVTALGVLLGLVLAALGGRLAQLQLHEHRAVADLQWERSHRERDVAARRGSVLDRFGRPLSESVEGFEIWVWPPSLYAAWTVEARREDPRPTELSEATYEARLYETVRESYEQRLAALADRLAAWTLADPAEVFHVLRRLAANGRVSGAGRALAQKFSA